VAAADNGRMPAGPAAAALAYVLWGIFPLYIKQIAAVPALEIVLHRSWWSMVFVFALLALARRLAWLRGLAGQHRLLALTAASALLLSANWLLYVWAVNADRVLDASLGYFINPLVNVLLGVVVLSERLNPRQWTAVAIAALGVAYLTWLNGALPWIALVLAITFGTYGLIRKTVAVEALSGLGAETLLIAPLGIVYLLWCEHAGSAALGHDGRTIDLLLVASGVVTAVPLALFAYGARLIPYSTVGLVQYIGPTLQLLTGVLLYREPFTAARAAGFVMIWVALAIYVIDGFVRSRWIPAAATVAGK